MIPQAAQIKPSEAKREADRRTLARAKFHYFCRYVDPKFDDVAHMHLIAEKLEAVERYLRTDGKEGIGRLMILMPPRHGKSENASRKFPAWVLGRLPDSRIILTSYGADLASKNSKAVRDLVESKRYQALYGGLSSANEPVELSSDSRSVAAWDLAQPHRGGVVAAGVGGGITGLGADLLICDDLIKNRDEAESESRREMVDDWYKSSALTRLEKAHAAVIMFFTHWHPDDQVGRLMKRMVEDPHADQWDILMLPALALDEYARDAEAQRQMMRDGMYVPLSDPLRRKPGEALWPRRFNAESLLDKRSNIGTYEFEALYQQMPYLRNGEFFKREWFTVVDVGPNPEDVVMRYRVWDKAGTKTGIGGDFSVGVLMSITRSDQIFVEHVSRQQCTPMKREQTIVDIAKSDRERKGPAVKIHHQQDPGSAGLDSAQATNWNLAKYGFKATFETLTGDKEVRAGPWSSACQSGHVFLVRGAWNNDYVEEHIAFPKGKWDDQVDVSSTGYSKLIRRPQKEAKSYQG